MGRNHSKSELTLFHVTPKKNYLSIRTYGILPTKSQGFYQRIWLASKEKLAWALNHVSQWHEISKGKMMVLKVTIYGALVREIRPGVFICTVGIPSDTFVVIK